jgi:hypothetical protein
MMVDRAVRVGVAALLAFWPESGFGQAGPEGVLFAEPFTIAHALIQDDGAGTRFETEPVTDHYFDSWIVSVRGDGSRMVVDLVRREMVEIRPELGTWWSLSFDRWAELQARLVELEAEEAGTAVKSAAEPQEPLEWQIAELPAGADKAVAGGRAPRGFALRAEGVSESAEIWIDPSLAVSPRALDALVAFETALAGGGDKASRRPPVDQARRAGGGALAIRTVRQTGTTRVEDTASKIERPMRAPRELVEVPEGLARVAAPLEQIVAFMEEERRREQYLGRPELGDPVP